jgi:hypothetical protein
MRKIAGANRKRGTGKTAYAVHIATGLAPGYPYDLFML